MSDSSKSVFISYAHEDAEFAKVLYDNLRDAGVNIWFDKEDLRPGEEWKPAIRKAIRKSRYFLAILSCNSVKKRGFVHAEMADALDILKEFSESEIYIIPVRIDNCELPYEHLYEIQWTNLFPCWKRGLSEIMLSLQIKPSNNDMPKKLAPTSANVWIAEGYDLFYQSSMTMRSFVIIGLSKSTQTQ